MCHRGQAVSLRFNGYANILQWLEKFGIKYSDDNLYQPLMVGLRQKLQIYTALKDHPNMYKTMSEIQEVTRRCAAICDGIDGHDSKNSKTDVSNSMTSPSGKCLGTDVKDQWFSEWVDEAHLGELEGSSGGLSIRLGTNLVGKPQAQLNTLLRWLQSAPTRKELSDTEVEDVIRTEDPEDICDKCVLIQRLTTDTLSLRMFGPDPSPNSSIKWEKNFLILKDWLVQRAKYDELKRHMLLAFMQMQMLDKMVKASCTADCSGSSKTTRSKVFSVLESPRHTQIELATLAQYHMWLLKDHLCQSR